MQVHMYGAHKSPLFSLTQISVIVQYEMVKSIAVFVSLGFSATLHSNRVSPKRVKIDWTLWRWGWGSPNRQCLQILAGTTHCWRGGRAVEEGGKNLSIPRTFSFAPRDNCHSDLIVPAREGMAWPRYHARDKNIHMLRPYWVFLIPIFIAI